MISTPNREEWPALPAQSEAGSALTDVIITTFRLNGRLMDAAQEMAKAGGLTAAWWQVLGGVIDRPHTVAEVGRNMGMSRQGVQRIADVLVDRGLARYQSNPAHRRAKLLACTESGYWAIRRISMVAHPWADDIGAAVGAQDLRTVWETMQRLIALLEAAPLKTAPLKTGP